jgi:hypothetical protein
MTISFTWVTPNGIPFGVVVDTNRTLNDWQWDATLFHRGRAQERLSGVAARENEIKRCVEQRLTEWATQGHASTT